MSAAPWTEAHQREALIRSAELLVFSLRRDLPMVPASGVADTLGNSVVLARGADDVATEAGWRRWLGVAAKWANTDREVRRVDDLATGRKVRETVWRVTYADGAEGLPLPEEKAREIAGYYAGNKLVRRVRIRRAT